MTRFMDENKQIRIKRKEKRNERDDKKENKEIYRR